MGCVTPDKQEGRREPYAWPPSEVSGNSRICYSLSPSNPGLGANRRFVGAFSEN